MKLTERLRAIWRTPEQRDYLTTSSNPARWLYEAFGALPSEAGVVVSERTAMSLSAFWTCVNLISGQVASLPLKVYERQAKGRRTATDHRMWTILHDRPSPEDTSFNWRVKAMGSLLVCGNSYTEIVRNGRQEPAALYPWCGASVAIRIGKKRGEYEYVVTDSSGERVVAPKDMIHLRGFCYDGLMGYSVVQNHRRSLGLAIATEEFASHFYSNGARASGIIMTPGRISEVGKNNLREAFDEKHSGLKNAHKTLVLEDGVKYQQLTVTQNDAQFLETRQMSRAEVAGMFMVPTIFVPGADRTPPTYASSESFLRYFVDFTLRSYLSMWQAELNSKIFDYGDYYAEFDTRDLLRANAAERAALHKAMWEIGAKSANDINEDENENPVPGGERYFIPANNFVPVDRVDDVIDAGIKKDSAPPMPKQPPSKGGQASVPRGYFRLFRDACTDIQEFQKYGEGDRKRAAKKLGAILRALADDLVGPDRADAAVGRIADDLASRVRGMTEKAVTDEFDRAVEEIQEAGASDGGEEINGKQPEDGGRGGQRRG